MKRLLNGYYYAMYYASWFWFGAVSLALNLGCALRLIFGRSPRTQAQTRELIRSLFELWSRWFHACGVLRIRWIGEPKEFSSGTVYVANHPSLLDATLVLSRIPNAFCIFKPALMNNPCIAPAAILADYLSSGWDADVIRRAAEKVSAGQALLVFPEGTRTAPGARLGPFRPGFALIAGRANAPIQTLLIRSSAGLVTRGRPWWLPPKVLPATLEIEYSRCWTVGPAQDPKALAAEIERHFAANLPPVA